MKAYRPTTAGIYIIVGAALATALATGNLVRPIKAVAGDPAGPFVQATFVDITPDNLGPYDGQAAANIRSLRPPEPYKGKGVRYLDERVRRKAGKAGKGAGRR